MGCEGELGRIVRDLRRQRGLSQTRLALRAGTSQDAISRIERGDQSPSFERFRELLLLMGHQPVLSVEPIDSSAGRSAQRSLDLSPEDRLRESASWNLAATTLETRADEARQAGHPATQRSSG